MAGGMMAGALLAFVVVQRAFNRTPRAAVA